MDDCAIIPPMKRLFPTALFAAALLAPFSLFATSGELVPPRAAIADDLFARAKTGDATAQRAIGDRYLNGTDVERNDAIAAEWYRKAAEQGEAAAEYRLALLYHLGRGVKQDDATAFKWMKKSADHGWPSAWFALGLYYEEGTGVMRNAAEALRCYRKAAKSNDKAARAFAENSIGRCYEFGIGVERNGKKAVSWFRKSAKSGNPAAMSNLAGHYAGGYDDDLNLDLSRTWREKARAVSPDDPIFGETVRGILETDRKVRTVLARGANTSEEQFFVGSYLVDGSFIDFDVENGILWLRRAADGGHVGAQRMLARIYAFGRRGIRKDPAEGERFFRMAATTGNDAWSQYQLAKALESGTLGTTNVLEAIDWYRKADANGVQQAKEALRRLSSPRTKGEESDLRAEPAEESAVKAASEVQ